jgi:predicted nuclease of predicted toxin-antitoxin system
VRFLVDQDVYEVTVELLRSLGHDVLRAKDAGLSRAEDADMLAYAWAEGRILVTRDKGYGALVFVQVAEHSGVILLRMTPQTLEATHEELRRLLSAHSEHEMRCRFVTVEPGRHRIRSGRGGMLQEQTIGT